MKTTTDHNKGVIDFKKPQLLISKDTGVIFISTGFLTTTNKVDHTFTGTCLQDCSVFGMTSGSQYTDLLQEQFEIYNNTITLQND